MGTVLTNQSAVKSPQTSCQTLGYYGSGSRACRPLHTGVGGSIQSAYCPYVLGQVTLSQIASDGQASTLHGSSLPSV